MSIKKSQNRTYRHGKIAIKDNCDCLEKERVIEAKRKLFMHFSYSLKNHIHVLNESND